MARESILLSEFMYRFRGAGTDEIDALLAEYDDLPSEGRSGCLHHYLKDYSWWIHEGDLRISADLLNDINLIIKGDLIVDGDYCDLRHEGMIVVFGSMRCRHVFSQYGMVITQDLMMTGLNYQYYNDYQFECAGHLTARAFISDDKSCAYASKRLHCEAWHNGYSAFNEGGDPYRLLGLDLDEDDDVDVVEHIIRADEEGRDPFVVAAPAPSTPWQEAMHAATGHARLVEMARPHGWDVVMRPNLAPELQTILSRHAESRVRWALASAPGVLADLLRDLAVDLDPSVRAAVASHKDCPDDLWLSFATDAAPEVRAAVVHAHGTGPAAWVLPLADDPVALVRRAVAVVPNLPESIVAALTKDDDTAVKNRTLRVQRLPAAMVRAQCASSDAKVRINLAQSAASGAKPFGREDVYLPLRVEALQGFMLDPSAAVREAATVGWLPPGFYEQHGERFVSDEVADVRRMLACITRQSTWLDMLADDKDEYVVRAAVENPNASAQTLWRVFERYAEKPFSNVHSSLMENPRLPPDVLERMFLEVKPADDWTAAHPRAPIRAMLQRCRNYSHSAASKSERALYERCLQLFHDTPEPTRQQLDEMFGHIFKARPRNLLEHSLANIACPPDLLARFVVRYLHSPDDRDGIESVAANPMLPLDSMCKLAAYLVQERDGDVLKGLLRNPAFPADLLAALAEGLEDASDRQKARTTLWLLHGIADIDAVVAARLDGIIWQEALDPRDVAEQADEFERLVKEGDQLRRDGAYLEAIDALEQARQMATGEGQFDYRNLYVHYAIMQACLQLAFYEEDADEDDQERARIFGQQMAERCLEQIPRHAIMPFTDMGRLEQDAIRSAQHYFARNALYLDEEDHAALRDALARIDEALGYSRGQEDDYLLATRADLLVALGKVGKINLNTALGALRVDAFRLDLGNVTIAALEKLIAAEPGRPHYYAALGDYHWIEEGNQRAAADAYAEAVRLLGTESGDDDTGCRRIEVICSYGWVLRILQDYVLAEKMLLLAHSLGPDDEGWYAKTLNQLFLLYCDLKDVTKRLQYARELAEIENTGDNRAALAFAHFELGQYEDALREATVAVALDNGNAYAHHLRGVALLKLGRLEEALVNCRRAVTLDPADAEYRYDRGHVYFRMGELDLASKDYAKACALDPTAGYGPYDAA